MPTDKAGRPVHKVKKSYALIETAVREAGTIALIQRVRTCQDMSVTAYAIVATQHPLLLKTPVLEPLLAAGQSGRFTVRMRDVEAWFADIDLARAVFRDLAQRKKIPWPDPVRRLPRAFRRQRGWWR